MLSQDLTEKMAAYATVKAFLNTEAAIGLCKQIEQETGKPATSEEGLDVWCHPRLAKMFAHWLDSPDLIGFAKEYAHDPGTPPYIV